LLTAIIAESGGKDNLAVDAAAAASYHTRSHHVARKGQGDLSHPATVVGTRQQFHHLPGTNAKVLHLPPTGGPT